MTTEVDVDLVLKKGLPLKQFEKDDSLAPYFAEYIRRQLEKIDEELDINLYKDGLMVHTTLDTRIQKALEDAFKAGMTKNQTVLNKEFLQNPLKLEEAIGYTNFDLDSARFIIETNDTIPVTLRNQMLVQGAGVVIDPTQGLILGMVGG